MCFSLFFFSNHWNNIHLHIKGSTEWFSRFLCQTSLISFCQSSGYVGILKSIDNKCRLQLWATIRCSAPPSTTPSEGIALLYATKITEMEKGVMFPLCLILPTCLPSRLFLSREERLRGKTAGVWQMRCVCIYFCCCFSLLTFLLLHFQAGSTAACLITETSVT